MWLAAARKTVMSVVAALIVYGNVAVIFNPHKLALPLESPWPRPFLLHDAFLLTGMFTSFATENVDFVIGGRTVPRQPDDKPEWIRLSLNEMIPGRLGIKFTQLLVARHWDMLGVWAQRAAWASAAKKIRARHNRLHPDRPIDAVRIGVVSWPLDPRSYRAAKPKQHARYRDWYNDETPPK